MVKRELAFLLAAGLGCAGCGGGGGSTPQSANPFAGSYLGEYVDQNGKAGEFQLAVQLSGAVTGQYFEENGTLSTVKGTINAEGHGTMTYGSGTAGIQMDRFDQQTSALNIVPVKPGTPVAEVALTPSPGVSLPAGNPYAGNYAGILRDTTANTSGALAIVISASGAVWGQEITNVNGNFSSYTISGTMSASGALNVTLLEVQQTITGTVSRATNVYGPVQFGNGDAGNLVFYPFASPFGPPPPHQ